MIAIAALLMALEAPAPIPAAVVAVSLSGLRNARGTVRVCMTRDPAHFPDCRGDPAALTRSVPAATRTVEFAGVAPGDYAIAVFHDANNNRKLDTFLGIPREGFGFSRNPTIRFGSPRFTEVRIRIGPGFSRTSVRMQYLI